MKSSLSRDRCTPIMARQKRNSQTKSRSLDRVQTILGNAGEAEPLGHGFAIQHDRRPGDGARRPAEAHRCARGIRRSRSTSRSQRFDLGEKIMRQRNGLRPLQMRVSRHQNILVVRGQVDKARCNSAQAFLARPRSRLSRRAAYRAPSGRSGCAPCAVWRRPPRSAWSAPPRCSCARLRVFRPTRIFRRAISSPIARNPFSICSSSSAVRIPAAPAPAACAIEPAMSCRYSRRSNETDSLKRRATSAAGVSNRPLRILIPWPRVRVISTATYFASGSTNLRSSICTSSIGNPCNRCAARRAARVSINLQEVLSGELPGRLRDGRIVRGAT